MLNSKKRKSLPFRLLVSVIQICFISSFIAPSRVLAQSPADLGLPKPGAMVQLSSAYVPVLIKGLKVHPENPILFDFLVDAGNSGITSDNAQLRKESERLIKYFLASLTIPEQDLWVNLSPYEKNRIVPEALGQTEMGRDMLAQDYLLKQLTASMIYPEKDLGKAFWNKVYAKSQQLYGTNNIPMNTFNKVWIVADKAKVYVHDNTAFVVKSHLKVMLEEDYLAVAKNQFQSTTAVGSQIIRDIILPELEKEVNQGKNFANLRQIFNSMILAAWYKKNLKQALLNQVYSNKAKLNGVDVADKTIKEQIYQEYLKAYKKGVFNYIKEDVQANGQATPRKYFSGGIKGVLVGGFQEVGLRDPDAGMFARKPNDGAMFSVSTVTPADQALMSVPKPEDFGVDPQTAEAWRLATPEKASDEFAKVSVEQRGKGFKFIPSEFKKPSDLKRFVGQKGVVIDIGGTNLKIEEQVVEATDDGQINIRVLGQPLYVKLEKDVREEWTGEEKIGFFITKLTQWIAQKGIDAKILGIAFSFDQQKGVVLPGAHGSKGWNWADLVGKDLYQMINKKLEEKESELGISLPRVTAITNDSESTAAFGDGGKITGTGANEFMWIEANGQGYNIESGKQEAQEFYTADELKTSSSELDGRIEAVMAAKHLGRLAWIRIKNLVNNEGYFSTRTIGQIAQSFLADDYNEQNGLSSQEITNLAVLDNVEQVREKLTSWGIADPTLKEAEDVWKIAKDIVGRSIWLNAAQLWGQAQLFKRTNRPLDMIVDGSMWKVPGYLQAVQGLLDQWSPNLMTLRYVEGATQKGTLILALSNQKTKPAEAKNSSDVLRAQLQQQIDLINQGNNYRAEMISQQGHTLVKLDDLNEEGTSLTFMADSGFRVISRMIKGEEILRQKNDLNDLSSGLFFMAPWVSRLDGSRITRNGRTIILTSEPGNNMRKVERDGQEVYLQTIEGLFTKGDPNNNPRHGVVRSSDAWKNLKIIADGQGVAISAEFETTDYPGLAEAFGHSKTTVTLRLQGRELQIIPVVENLTTEREALRDGGYQVIADFGVHDMTYYSPGQTTIQVPGAVGVLELGPRAMPTGKVLPLGDKDVTQPQILTGGVYDNTFVVPVSAGNPVTSILEDSERKLRITTTMGGDLFIPADGQALFHIWDGSDAKGPNAGISGSEPVTAAANGPNQVGKIGGTRPLGKGERREGLVALTVADLIMNAGILQSNKVVFTANKLAPVQMTGVSFDNGDFIKDRKLPNKVSISRAQRSFFFDNKPFDGLYVNDNQAKEVNIPEFSKVLVLGPWVIIVDPEERTLRLAVANSINNVLINPNDSEQVRTAFSHVPLNPRDMFWRATTKLDNIDLSKTQLFDDGTLRLSFTDGRKDAVLDLAKVAQEVFARDAALTTGPGGIDLNSRNMQMDVEGQEINLRFDAAMMSQFQQGNFSGIRPQIIKVTPIFNMRPLLGLAPAKESEEDERLAKV